MKKSQFSERVYMVVKQIPKGKVATYGQIANFAGKPKAARAVGQALHRNPYAPAVPCHRVVSGSGDLCGFARGLKAKEKILKSEGIKVVNQRVDLGKYLCR